MEKDGVILATDLRCGGFCVFMIGIRRRVKMWEFVCMGWIDEWMDGFWIFDTGRLEREWKGSEGKRRMKGFFAAVWNYVGWRDPYMLYTNTI